MYLKVDLTNNGRILSDIIYVETWPKVCGHLNIRDCDPVLKPC